MSDFKLIINLADLQKQLETDLKSRTQTSIQKLTTEFLQEPRPWNKNDKGGTGYQLIAEKITEHFLAEDSQAFISDRIKNSWEDVLATATDAAMKRAAEHQANRIAFKNIGERQAAKKAE